MYSSWKGELTIRSWQLKGLKYQYTVKQAQDEKKNQDIPVHKGIIL